jgi:hypothetical protein
MKSLSTTNDSPHLHAGYPRAGYISFATSPDQTDPVLTITPEGRFFCRGKEVETDEEVRDLFTDWVRMVLKGFHDNAADKPTAENHNV